MKACNTLLQDGQGKKSLRQEAHNVKCQLMVKGPQGLWRIGKHDAGHEVK
jgi:hypothetical protein